MSLISRWDLIPGQWVVFSHDVERIPTELAGPFKVIKREDHLFDSCRCYLEDIEGHIFDYCPRMGEVDYKSLPWGYNVKVLTKYKAKDKMI